MRTRIWLRIWRHSRRQAVEGLLRDYPTEYADAVRRGLSIDDQLVEAASLLLEAK